MNIIVSYFCDPSTLVNRNGFSQEKADRLHASFHELYKEYFDYIDTRLAKGSSEGFVLLAGGLRLDTPALHKGLTSDSVVAAEYRSVGNAVSQSYGSLTFNAARKFMERVWNSEYKLTIKVFNNIHDAIYVLVPSNPEAIHWTNTNLIECMRDTQDYPELYHPLVKLEAEADLRLTDWSSGTTLSNNISIEEIKSLLTST